MSETVGSASSGSSGPKPNTSSRTSCARRSRSCKFMGVDSPTTRAFKNHPDFPPHVLPINLRQAIQIQLLD